MKRVHGLISILLFFLAVGIAAWTVFQSSALYGWLYLVVTVLGTLGIVYSFCCKCCSKHQCSHIILGMMAKKMPKRPVGKYTKWDVVGMASSFFAVVAFPQVWLWSYLYHALLFWALALFIVWEIAHHVCPSCKNTLCPLHT
ncbi:MAG: hypothetical protein OEM52_01860 [bacterium]|nr:hypothetical protein [bacterium]